MNSNPLDDLIWSALKKGLAALLALLGAVACAPSDSPSVSHGAPAFAPDPDSPSDPVARTISLIGGVDFTCFNLTLEDGSGRIYCRRSGGQSPDPRLGLSSSTFQLFAESQSGWTHFEVWDGTICASAIVDQRPAGNTTGQATYCWGEATLGANYSSYPLVYGGPVFSFSQHGSPDVAFHGTEEAFVGGDIGIGLFTNEGGVWNVMTDGSGSTHSDSEDCTLSETELTCESFTVGL